MVVGGGDGSEIGGSAQVCGAEPTTYAISGDARDHRGTRFFLNGPTKAPSPPPVPPEPT
ncbi:hypothetical protein AB0J82_11425 [Asanoa sp. NPDC049518]|uniref:hypothetical protein n=1 Tax=unclassified Asanoa TaxID=2685164 RepID=UPI0034204D0A